jgi:hypothetical protein
LCQATAKNGPEATRKLAPLCEALTKGSAQAAVLSPLEQSSRDAALESPEVVQAILGLTAAGCGRRPIAQELEWGEVYSFGEGCAYGDQVVATAILDLLLHHSHVLTVRGDSYRLREKRRSGLIKTSSAVSTIPTTGKEGSP